MITLDEARQRIIGERPPAGAAIPDAQFDRACAAHKYEIEYAEQREAYLSIGMSAADFLMQRFADDYGGRFLNPDEVPEVAVAGDPATNPLLRRGNTPKENEVGSV